MEGRYRQSQGNRISARSLLVGFQIAQIAVESEKLMGCCLTPLLPDALRAPCSVASCCCVAVRVVARLARDRARLKRHHRIADCAWRFTFGSCAAIRNPKSEIGGGQ